jgi:hypothetical protein
MSGRSNTANDQSHDNYNNTLLADSPSLSVQVSHHGVICPKVPLLDVVECVHVAIIHI